VQVQHGRYQSIVRVLLEQGSGWSAASEFINSNARLHEALLYTSPHVRMCSLHSNSCSSILAKKLVCKALDDVAVLNITPQDDLASVKISSPHTHIVCAGIFA
jgi:hypothetical protein